MITWRWYIWHILLSQMQWNYKNLNHNSINMIDKLLYFSTNIVLTAKYQDNYEKKLSCLRKFQCQVLYSVQNTINASLRYVKIALKLQFQYRLETMSRNMLPSPLLWCQIWIMPILFASVWVYLNNCWFPSPWFLLT